MSEALKISSEEVRDWLQQETKSDLISIKQEAEQLLHEMDTELEKMVEVSNTLFDDSQAEIEKRSDKTYGRAKALNKLSKLFVKRMQQMEIPNEVSYQTFRHYVRKTRKAFISTEVDIKNWFPRISPYFILDRRKFEGAYQEAKETLEKLQTFLKNKYREVKTLEETFQLIDDLRNEEKELTKFKAGKKEARTTQTSLQQEIEETKEEMEELQDRGNLNRIDLLTQEIKKLKKEVRRKLQHLRKPIKKLYRIALKKGGLSPEESQKLHQYVTDPFNSFATDQPGYPFLKKVLKTIDMAINKGELELKQSRRRKAKEDIHRIIHQDSLATLHQKCRKTVTQKRRLTKSPKTKKAKRRLRELQKKLKKTKRRKKRIDLEKDRIERELKATQQRVHNQQRQIEKKLSNSLDRKINLQLTV